MNAEDDTVSSLSSTQCDTGSTLTDKDVAEWHRHLLQGPTLGDAYYPHRPLSDFLEGEEKKQKEFQIYEQSVAKWQAASEIRRWLFKFVPLSFVMIFTAYATEVDTLALYLWETLKKEGSNVI